MVPPPLWQRGGKSREDRTLTILLLHRRTSCFQLHLGLKPRHHGMTRDMNGLKPMCKVGMMNGLP